MSLLSWKTNADVIVYHEESYVDADGNTMLRASTIGVPARAEVQLQKQSGTSSRRAEQTNEGYETEDNYRIRFPRSWEDANGPLGQEAQIEWRGIRYHLVGNPDWYGGSSRTRHVDYVMRSA